MLRSLTSKSVGRSDNLGLSLEKEKKKKKKKKSLMSDSDKVFANFSLGAVMQKAQSNSLLENHAKNGKGRYGNGSVVGYLSGM